MEKTEKTVLIVGSLGVAVIVFLAWSRQQQANQIAALNSPGLLNQPGVAAQIGASDLIYSATSGLSSFLSSWFDNKSSQQNRELNEPGLIAQGSDAFPGMDYDYENSDPYSGNGYPGSDDMNTDDSGFFMGES